MSRLPLLLSNPALGLRDEVTALFAEIHANNSSGSFRRSEAQAKSRFFGTSLPDQPRDTHGCTGEPVEPDLRAGSRCQLALG